MKGHRSGESGNGAADEGGGVVEPLVVMRGGAEHLDGGDVGVGIHPAAGEAADHGLQVVVVGVVGEFSHRPRHQLGRLDIAPQFQQ
jgi:hypothetical protein